MFERSRNTHKTENDSEDDFFAQPPRKIAFPENHLDGLSLQMQPEEEQEVVPGPNLHYDINLLLSSPPPDRREPAPLQRQFDLGQERHTAPEPEPIAPLPFLLQPKLTVGAANDAYEQEADRVAAQVVSAINTPAATSPEPPADKALQRDADRQAQRLNPVRSQISDLRMKPLNLQQKSAPGTKGQPNLLLSMHETLQCQVGTEGGTVAGDIESSIQRARGSGQPLGDAVRTPMEQAFGADFSRVRVHTDSTADRLNRSLSARAFTTGSDLFFKQGEYNPVSSSGQHLLAHELTHVVQQGGAGAKPAATLQAKPVVRVQKNSTPTLQRLITSEALAEVDPVSKRSKKYPKVLAALNEFHAKADADALPDTPPHATGGPDSNIEPTDPTFELTLSLQLKEEAYMKLLDKIDALAAAKEGERPLLSLLRRDIERERGYIQAIYRDKDRQGYGTMGDALSILHEQPADAKARYVAQQAKLTGTDEQEAEDPEGGKVASLWKAVKPNPSSNPLRLVLEGAGHFIAGALLIAAGVGLTGTGIGAVIGVPAVVGGGGQVAVAILKWIRSYLGSQKKKFKARGAADKAASYDPAFNACIAIEGAIGLACATFIAVATGGVGAILGAIAGGLKIGRAAALATIKGAAKGTSGFIINLVTAIEAILGFAGSMAGALGGLAKAAAAGGAEATTNLVKAIANFVKDGVATIKASRAAAGVRGVIDNEAKEAEKAEAAKEDEAAMLGVMV